MKLWELIMLTLGFAVIFIFIFTFIISGSPLELFGISAGLFMVLSVLEMEYYSYFNFELAWVSLIVFQGLILIYICVFASIYILNILFYFDMGFFLYYLVGLYIYYKDPSEC